jgi:tetratricopeptide (TPR) repeat protein
MSLDPIGHWDSLLDTVDAAALCGHVTEGQRSRRLRFGDRVLCPFLRPFFLEAGDEARVKQVAETLWVLGERVARVAIDSEDVLRQLALSEPEIRLARIDPGYATTSTAARADAFILPDSLQFAEYNGESPAGAGYSQGLAEVFADEPLMGRFRERFDVRMYQPIQRLLEALIGSYREWGGTASPPVVAIVDWREVPTFSEFELLRDAFIALGVPTVIADPRDLEFPGSQNRLVAGGRAIDLVYRRVLINDIVSREDECRALLDAYEQRAVCVANSLRCKIPHKKAFFAVLTDQRYGGLFAPEEREMIRRHVPWTTMVEERRVSVAGQSVDLVAHLRANRDRFVIKPNDARAMVWIAQTMMSMEPDSLPGALDMYREAVAADSTSGDALRGAGLALVLMDNCTEAQGYLERATVLDPQHVQGHIWLAQTYSKCHDIPRAKIQFNQALEIDPTNVEASKGLDIIRKWEQQKANPGSGATTP